MRPQSSAVCKWAAQIRDLLKGTLKAVVKGVEIVRHWRSLLRPFCVLIFRLVTFWPLAVLFHLQPSTTFNKTNNLSHEALSESCCFSQSRFLALTSFILNLVALLGRHQLLERLQESTDAGELLLLTFCFCFCHIFFSFYYFVHPSSSFCNIHMGSHRGVCWRDCAYSFKLCLIVNRLSWIVDDSVFVCLLAVRGVSNDLLYACQSTYCQ